MEGKLTLSKETQNNQGYYHVPSVLYLSNQSQLNKSPYSHRTETSLDSRSCEFKPDKIKVNNILHLGEKTIEQELAHKEKIMT